MELGFWIPVVSGIPYSKAQDSGFYKQKLRGIRPEPALPYMGQDIRTVRRRIISTERRRDLVQFRTRTSCLHCLHLLQNQMSTRQIKICYKSVELSVQILSNARWERTLREWRIRFPSEVRSLVVVIRPQSLLLAVYGSIPSGTKFCGLAIFFCFAGTIFCD